MSKKNRNQFRQPSIPSDAKNIRLVREESHQEIHYSGPLPMASEFQKYEEICPGAASRLLTMVEEQAVHRHSLESKVVSSNVANERLGMWMAAVLTVILEIIGFILILKDKEVIGLFTVFSPVIFNAGNFIWHKRKESSLSHAKGAEEEKTR